jgi:hypothetical protein
MYRSISSSDELRSALQEYWDTYNAAADKRPVRTQLAINSFPDPAPLGPAVLLHLTVLDVADVYSAGLTVYGKLAAEEPRSILDELLRRREWVGRGILASFGSRERVPSETVERLVALRPADVVSVAGNLGTDGHLYSNARIYSDAVSRSFGDKEIYSAGFWWVLGSCRLV